MRITAINVRNQFRDTIKEIIGGQVVSEVDVLTRSIKELGLVPGKEAVALVKATKVSIAAL